MKILISAFSCQPGQGSEPGAGWGVVSQAALRHRVVVLTDTHNRHAIRSELDRRPLPSAHFVFLGFSPGYAHLEKNKLLGYAYYFLWQLAAFRVARRLHKKFSFDLALHATYVNSWAPALLGRLGIPFVWCAGVKQVTPWPFYFTLSPKSRLNEILRTLSVKWIGALTGALCIPSGAVILSSSGAGAWPKNALVQKFPIGALEDSEMAALGALPFREGESLRVASIGRLLGLKGFGLGLMAFSRLLEEHPASEYWIVGEGPERQWLEKMAARLGCSHRVRFMNWMPRHELFSLLAQVDVLLHPSLHEQFGYVVLEAMAAGRPVVSLAAGGSEVLADSGGGIAVQVTSPEQVVADLYKALSELAANPEFRRQAAIRARQAARRNWSWGTVGLRLEAIYRETAMRLRHIELGENPESSATFEAPRATSKRSQPLAAPPDAALDCDTVSPSECDFQPNGAI